ncbi:hypothetical protein JG491_36915 [Streptomyces sp. CRPSP2-6A1]|nr:hypothetical protein [Streptomyces sp. CRPSP2-6A1]MBJ7005562.1 hypothetical protein [Streptomyces sp. CRPSP2-6A1]
MEFADDPVRADLFPGQTDLVGVDLDGLDPRARRRVGHRESHVAQGRTDLHGPSGADRRHDRGGQ